MLPRRIRIGEARHAAIVVDANVRTVDAMRLETLPDADLCVGRRARGAELLVVGAGGVLGAALLARALGSGR